MDVDELLKSTETETFLHETGWLYEVGADEIDAIYSEFSGHFQTWLSRLSERLGSPDFTTTSDPDLADELYPEAIELAGWKQGNGYALLAFVQHDREAPVFLSFEIRDEEEAQAGQ